MTLPFGPDHLTDLVDGDLEADDLRCRVAHLVARAGDRALHDLEDLQSGILGLQQRGREDVGGDAGDLRVELQCRDELRRAGDLEVHVAERVFLPRMSVRVVYLPSANTRPIAMPATGALIGTPASISDSVEPQTDAIDVEPFDARTSETTRIVYGHSILLGSTGISARSANAP